MKTTLKSIGPPANAAAPESMDIDEKGSQTSSPSSFVVISGARPVSPRDISPKRPLPSLTAQGHNAEASCVPLPPPSNLEKWTCEQVAGNVRSLGTAKCWGKYAETLLEEDYDGATVMDLELKDLVDLGVKTHHARRIKKHFQEVLSKLEGEKAHTQKINEKTTNEKNEKRNNLQVYCPPVTIRLTRPDENRIIQLINSGSFDAKQILTLFYGDASHEKKQAVESFIETLFHPPRPIPKGSKLLTVDTNQVVLPVYQYPRVSPSRFKRYYTFLVIGQTGTGKTTLLDAFVNCLATQKFQDNWRWKLQDEDELNKLGHGASKTREISQFYISDERNADIECNIRIIDTPGFGDSKGFKQDDETVKKFEELFKEIEEIDYVLVTVKASETRWTPGNRYIYDRVQQIFGKDAAERFILMCTFADGAVPVAVRTLKPHLTFKKYFTFNNSALYTPSQQANTLTKMYWKMGNESVAAFLSYVVRRNAPPLNLRLSRKVLEQREYLYASISTTQLRIVESFQTLESSRRTMEQIKTSKIRIDANADFTYENEMEKFERKPLGGVYQACRKCQITCCQSCVWPSYAVESQCTYFSGGRGCPRCPGKCPKSDHVRTKELITKVKVVEKKENSEMKEAWEKAKSGLTASEWILRDQKKKMKEAAQQILSDMKTTKENLAELDKIAMKARVFTDEDYFCDLIKYEEESREPGHVTRIAGYKSMLDQARNFQKITSAEKVTDLFPQYEKVIEEIFAGEFHPNSSAGEQKSKDKKKSCPLM
mmetsp:Transcript_23107/g.56078  ORF Transcript_23107/g.56078 Transcript_23107/m.56078 type:complete len:769 (-) Transcript_23107:207-2513(-)